MYPQISTEEVFAVFQLHKQCYSMTSAFLVSWYCSRCTACWIATAFTFSLKFSWCLLVLLMWFSRDIMLLLCLIWHCLFSDILWFQLGTDTWFYAKRCFLSLLEIMAKHMIMLRDSVVQECIQFLEHCECKYILQKNGLKRLKTGTVSCFICSRTVLTRSFNPPVIRNVSKSIPVIASSLLFRLFNSLGMKCWFLKAETLINFQSRDSSWD